MSSCTALLKNNAILFLSFLFLSLGAVSPFYSYSQDNTSQDITSKRPAVLVAGGQIEKIDLTSSILTIRSNNEIVAFPVPAGTVIFRGAEKVELSGLVEGDYVVIKYYIDSDGDKRILSIVIDL